MAQDNSNQGPVSEARRLPPSFVDVKSMDRVSWCPFSALPRTFRFSPILSTHMLKDSFSLARAKHLAKQRFRIQPERNVHTVMPKPREMAIYVHNLTGTLLYKCEFSPCRVYTFFRDEVTGCITVKIEQRVNLWFTEIGHLAYVERY